MPAKPCSWLWSTLLLYTMVSTLVTAQNATQPTNIRLGTWNLRFDSMPDNITVQESLDALPDPLVQPAFLNLTGEQPWSTRRIKVAQRLIGEGVVLQGAFGFRLVSIQVHTCPYMFGFAELRFVFSVHSEVRDIGA